MLALFLSSCILIVLLHQMLVAKKQEMKTHSTLAKAYDLDIISEVMKSSIRQAGYTPCAVIDKLKHRDHTHSQKKLEAISLDSAQQDSLTVSYMVQPVVLIEEFSSLSEIRLQGHPAFSQDDIVMIADCFHAEVVQLRAITSDKNDSWLMLRQALSFSYQKPAYVGVWQSRRFFMKKNTKGIPRLYFQQKHTESLSDWIEGMSIHQMIRDHARLIQIIFHLPDSETWTMQVRMRAS